MMNQHKPLILASGSQTRKALLDRLHVPYSVVVSEVDETPLASEAPKALALRLAQTKALAVARQQPNTWVIGSDQVASLSCHADLPLHAMAVNHLSDDLQQSQQNSQNSHNQQKVILLEKPLTEQNACAQLALASGQSVQFDTAVTLCCLDANANPLFLQTMLVPYVVKFRVLSTVEIARYVAIEQPLQCAGSFKCEGLGIALFESTQGDDQTALMGLPLIALCQLLRKAGFLLP